MSNPFNVSEEKLKMLLAGYNEWLKTDTTEAQYHEKFVLQAKNLKEELLNVEVLSNLDDDELFKKIFKYSRELEGPVHMRLGEPRIRGELSKIRRNLKYILTTKDSPFTVAQKILAGEYKIDVFAKAFWTPIFQTQFPDVLPNWNNKTDKFFRKFGINLSSSRLSIAEKYKILSDAFKFLSGISEGHDFYTINHLMHYGTVIPEGEAIIKDILQPDNHPKKNKVLDLKGKRLYKISHGVFIKHPPFSKAGILSVLEKNNWISMGVDTGKGQITEFTEKAQIGDYVYVCYGGDKVYCVAEIVSESRSFDEKIKSILVSDKEWVYREIKPLFFPQDNDVSKLKGYKKAFMPSGNTTFWQVPKNQLEYMNEKVFIPKFNLKMFSNENTRDAGSKSPSIPQTLTLNTILYGPPGTGKTYHCISHAVSIIEGKSFEDVCLEDRIKVKDRFEQYRKEERVIFTTFHQSMGYEDFIEGIKPKINEDSENEDETALSYFIEDGIFKNLATEAAFSYVQRQTKKETGDVLDFSDKYDAYIETLNEKLSKGKPVELTTRSGGKIKVEGTSQNNNIWISHINGSRKYTVSKRRLGKLAKAFPDLSEVTNIYEQFRKAIRGSNHSAYWAVLNDIRNHFFESSTDIDEKGYSYDEKKAALETLNNEDYKVDNDKNFVLIIDEINRGNVSQVFGELITLIEDDKRLGRDEALKIKLPYSKEEFGVPCNLHIIGTMNTADRSVEALDSALRRRFSFVEIVPKPEVLKTTEDGINLPAMLKVLNQRLAILKDDDHTIGHAWLWNVKNTEELKIVFGNKILPLLREYFYNDYEKLGLVLGNQFFKLQQQVQSNMFASFKGGNGLAGQYDNVMQFQLKSINELTFNDFKSLEALKTEPETLDEE